MNSNMVKYKDHLCELLAYFGIYPLLLISLSVYILALNFLSSEVSHIYIYVFSTCISLTHKFLSEFSKLLCLIFPYAF